jgi:hypothetical protein
MLEIVPDGDAHRGATVLPCAEGRTPERRDAMHRFTELLKEEQAEERRFREEAAKATSLEERVKVLEENLRSTQAVLRHLLQQLGSRLDEEHDEDDHIEARLF